MLGISTNCSLLGWDLMAHIWGWLQELTVAVAEALCSKQQCPCLDTFLLLGRAGAVLGMLMIPKVLGLLLGAATLVPASPFPS